MKRVLVAGLQHESNSFNPIVTGEKDFQVIRGAEVFNRFRPNDPVSGVIKPLMEQGYEVVPTVFASAVPNGEVDHDFYMNLKAEIIRVAKEEQAKKPIDAITLALHGSMRVKGLGEAEGYLLEELRQIFPDIPLFCSLDMHTTMTERMHNNCDGFVGYKCAPHTDRYETGEHAARMTIAALENGFQAHSALGQGADSDCGRAVLHHRRADEWPDRGVPPHRNPARHHGCLLPDGFPVGGQ